MHACHPATYPISQSEMGCRVWLWCQGLITLQIMEMIGKKAKEKKSQEGWVRCQGKTCWYIQLYLLLTMPWSVVEGLIWRMLKSKLIGCHPSGMYHVWYASCRVLHISCTARVLGRWMNTYLVTMKWHHISITNLQTTHRLDGYQSGR